MATSEGQIGDRIKGASSPVHTKAPGKISQNRQNLDFFFTVPYLESKKD